MATSVHEVIDAFRKAPSNSERGTRFEQLMVRYFQLDPMLSQQYDQVWRWSDWPGRDGKTDTGIDLVAVARDTGEHTAIQCKFYEPTHTLGKGDVDSFFTASGRHWRGSLSVTRSRPTRPPFGIVNDPNDWRDESDVPGHIVELIQKVAPAAVETMKVVDSLVALPTLKQGDL